MLAGVGSPRDGEVLGGETRNRRKARGHIAVERATRTQRRRVNQADDIAGPGVVEGCPLLAEHRLRVLGDERFTGGGVSQNVAALESAGTDTRIGDAVAV